MALNFGTSGVRGLETDLTDESCARFARAFVRHFNSLGKATDATKKTCIIGGDYRRSTPRIMKAVAQGLALEGYSVLDAGKTPTPALAYACLKHGLPGIMVTGSHIPADRNGIKFYFPWGEILKPDEGPILEFARQLEDEKPAHAAVESSSLDANQEFIDRYKDHFGPKALAGLKIAFYEHSTVAREVTPKILEALGAEVIRFWRSEEFIPVDTEALEKVQDLANQLHEHKADALLSADGDGDRPLLLDEKGRVVRGDQLGQIAAAALDADSVSTPVSSSTALEKMKRFAEIRRCKIGSPFVVAEMEAALKAGKKRVVGYEANGGFLLGSAVGKLRELPTRDSVLPAILALAQAATAKKPLSAIIDALPARFTGSDLIRPFAVEKSRAVLDQIKNGKIVNDKFTATLGEIRSVDRTDGVRFEFANGDILHFRPSGNAPEFRIYSESALEAQALKINAEARRWIEGLSA